MTGITALPATGHSFPITTYIPQSNIQQQGGNKNASVQSSYSVQAMPGGAFTTIFAPGTSVQLGQNLSQGQQQGSTVQVGEKLTFSSPFLGIFYWTSEMKSYDKVFLSSFGILLFCWPARRIQFYGITLTLALPKVAKVRIEQKFQILLCKMLKNK